MGFLFLLNDNRKKEVELSKKMLNAFSLLNDSQYLPFSPSHFAQVECAFTNGWLDKQNYHLNVHDEAINLNDLTEHVMQNNNDLPDSTDNS